MKPFIFSTDTTADLPQDFVEKYEIAIHPLHYLIDEKEYGMDIEELTPREFYRQVRDGKMPTTNATSIEYDTKLFTEAVEAGKEVLHLSFSSAMSSSYSNAVLAANTVKERYPDCRIIVIDTLSATGAMRYLIERGLALQAEGKDIEEVADWIRSMLPHMVLHFTVPDLYHLLRGGRVKKSTAVLGTALKIQPMLHISDEGTLLPIGKVRGRDSAIRALAKEIGALKDAGSLPDAVHITHGDCEEDAQKLADRIRTDYGIEQVTVGFMCPTLGAHAGAGVIAIGYPGLAR